MIQTDAILNQMSDSTSKRNFHKSIRFPGYDYSQPGPYFITILTNQRRKLLSKLVEGKSHLTPLGELAANVWIGLPDRFPEVEIDEFIVMPDHIHGIISLTGSMRNPTGGGSLVKPLPPRLGVVIGTYKSVVTKVCHARSPENQGLIWQRNYYEHIIRNEYELNRIRDYIQRNPIAGDVDEPYPDWLE